jgi:hypothetical protein
MAGFPGDAMPAIGSEAPDALGMRAIAPGGTGAAARRDEALATIEQVLADDPNHGPSHNARGVLLMQMNRFPEALASFAKAQELMPQDAEAHCNEGVARLMTGDLVRGFEKYEWRWKRDAASRRNFGRPQWDGLDTVYDRTILLHGEGRLSDTIQFCRYAPQVAGRGARVIVEVAPALRRLAASLPGVAEVVPRGDALPAFDLHCPFTSLPRAFGTKLETIPSATPYLRPPTEEMLAWETRLGAIKRPRIGIAWAGGPEADDGRAMPLATMLPLLAVDASFVRLQKNLRDGDAALLETRGELFDPTDMINDLADTAALMARLDLIVSADTSVAHLAGAIGKSVFILLPSAADWRWLIGLNTTRWYPSARLFRQARPGDWDEVIMRIATELPRAVGRDPSTAATAGAARNVS